MEKNKSRTRWHRGPDKEVGRVAPADPNAVRGIKYVSRAEALPPTRSAIGQDSPPLSPRVEKPAPKTSLTSEQARFIFITFLALVTACGAVAGSIEFIKWAAQQNRDTPLTHYDPNQYRYGSLDPSTATPAIYSSELATPTPPIIAGYTAEEINKMCHPQKMIRRDQYGNYNVGQGLPTPVAIEGNRFVVLLPPRDFGEETSNGKWTKNCLESIGDYEKRIADEKVKRIDLACDHAENQVVGGFQPTPTLPTNAEKLRPDEVANAVAIYKAMNAHAGDMNETNTWLYQLVYEDGTEGPMVCVRDRTPTPRPSPTPNTNSFYNSNGNLIGPDTKTTWENAEPQNAPKDMRAYAIKNSSKSMGRRG